MDALVDFSGDSGVMGKGTRWLVVSAACDLTGDGSLETALAEIRSKSKYPDEKPVHLKGKPHSYKRAVVQRLAALNWTSVTVASDTFAIQKTSGLSVPQRNMNYAMKYVLERVSRIASARREPLTFILEEAGNFDLDSFREYIDRLRAKPPSVDLMAWDSVDSARIVVKTKTEDHRLSVADAVAHSYWCALMPDADWGLLEPCYVEALRERIWADDSGRMVRAGFTFIPPTRDKDYLEEFPQLAAVVQPD